VVHTVSPADQALWDLLVQEGVLSKSQLAYAQQWAKIGSGSVAGQLVRLGLVSDVVMGERVAQSRQLPFQAALAPADVSDEALGLCRRDVCLSMSFMPLKVVGQDLWVWLGEDDGQRAREWIGRRLGMTMRPIQGPFLAVQQAVATAFAMQRQRPHELLGKELRRLLQDVQGSLGTEALITQLVVTALSERATDIHLTPGEEGYLISLRIDGVLMPVEAVPRTLARLISSIKVMSSMDISDNLRPQDGRFTHASPTHEVDVRVSTAVTPMGESVVMRLLSKNNFVMSLDELGFLASHLPMLRRLFGQPYGLLLLAGPTGSGKTTTLYAGLRGHAMSGKNIMTVEDPVEYRMPSAVQTQVNRKSGYDFASAIRHFLRHDPDIMLVGEIRDAETAAAASRAAETGHLVLSTLHVNNVFSVPSRLTSMGLERQAIADTLMGVINQRLVRCLCTECRHPQDPAQVAMPEWLRQRLQGRVVYTAAGCAHCRGTGYRGRLPVYEVLGMDAPLSQWVSEGGGRHAALPHLHTHNHVAMVDVCVERMVRGELSFQELSRVLGVFDQYGLGSAVKGL
jgi:type II secretory ATPase GspE/PulE/Tfp pilus assembly ATPase PilB-like protein